MAQKQQVSYTPFSRKEAQDKACPVPAFNWCLYTVLILASLALMVDAYLWAPKRCECEQAVVDGPLPFSQCSLCQLPDRKMVCWCSQTRKSD